jgi:hypothetical protein
MAKADVLNDTWWIGDLAGPFLPEDLAAAMVALSDGGDTGILIGLSPRALYGVRISLTERTPSGFRRLNADAVQQTMPLSEVEGWTFKWSGPVQRGMDADTLTRLRTASAELHLRRDFLGFGTTLELPLDEQETRDEAVMADQIRAFLAALESMR